mmetsp:Transcript_37350/g.95600  ORF Transcript_37350/g.95600 Transcript_37350/m.95600 type:complete len:112 (+) Transcript_37350:2132-2467(+)
MTWLPLLQEGEDEGEAEVEDEEDHRVLLCDRLNPSRQERSRSGKQNCCCLRGHISGKPNDRDHGSRICKDFPDSVLRGSATAITKQPSSACEIAGPRLLFCRPNRWLSFVT